MTNHENHLSNSKELPFFARYLEGQITQEISAEEAKKIGGGLSPLATFKYPSDVDEIIPPKDAATTHKFPSDLDEGLEH